MDDSAGHTPRDPAFAERVRACFEAQAVMGTIGATLERIEPGAVDLAVAFRDELTQQNGFLHAGVITALVDSACGFAALSLMAPGADVLSIEFKVNLLRPAVGARFVAEGRVIRSGRTITVCSGRLWAIGVDEESPEGRKEVAVMQATMMTMK